MTTGMAGWRMGRLVFPPLVWIVLAGTLLTRTAFFMVWPFLSVILARDFSLRPSRIGTILGLASLSGAAIGFYSGHVSDRLGRRPVMILGCLSAVVAYIVLALGRSVSAYCVGAVLAGVGTAAIEAPGKAVIADYVDDRRAREIAFHARYFLINVGAGVGPLAGVLFGLSARRATFWITVAAYALFALVMGIAFRWTPERAHPDARRVSLGDAVRVLRADSRFLLLLLAMFLVYTAYSQEGSTLVQYVNVRGGERGITLVTALLMTNAVTIVVFQFPLLRALGRWELMRRTYLGLAFVVLAFITYAVLPVRDLAPWVVAVWVLSVGESVLFPTLQLQVDHLAPAGLKGSYFGAAGLSSLGFGVGPLIGGFLLEYIGGPMTFWLMAAMLMVSAWCCRRAARHGVPVEWRVTV